MENILYSTGCPKCRVLEAKLQAKNVPYKKNNDVAVMEEKGMMSLPYLEIDGKLMDFGEAVRWVNSIGD